MNFFIEPLIAFLAVAVLIPIVIKLAPRLKLMDAPDERKQHEGEIPLIGGIVIFPVFMVVAMLAGFGFEEFWSLYLGLLTLLILGVVDDRMHLHPWVKFFVQCAVAVLIVFAGGAKIQGLGDIFGLGNFDLGFMAIPFSLAAVVLLINAINLMDGLDGLAAGYVAVALGWIAFGYWNAGAALEFLLVVIILAAIAGFLVHNLRSPILPHARVFLGDAGSMCLGLCLAWFAIDVAKNPIDPALQPMSVAWILALPIMDTCAQFYRRVREGRHPFSPDRGHLHHHFIHAGFAHGKAVMAILGVTALTGAFGVVGYMMGVPLVVLTVSWVFAILLHMQISDKPERYVRMLSRFGLDPK